MKKAKRDPKKQPFAWQEKHILRLIQKTFKGNEQLDNVDLTYNNVQFLYSTS